MSHARRLLARALDASVVDFRCHAGVHGVGAEEPSATHQIVLVRRGVFRCFAGGDSVVADAHHVLFFNAGEGYRYAHPLPGGDDCTVIEVPALLARELVAVRDPRRADASSAPFPFGHYLGTRNVLRLHYELLAQLRRPGCELALEDLLAQLALAAVAAAYPRGAREAAAPPSPRVRRRHRELCEQVQLILNERLEAPPSLADLARTLGGSPFHLSRIFASTVGVSLRGYLGGLRTRVAAARLADGAADLTDLALDLGFGDHSHFTHAFHAAWGEPPSAFRARYRH